MPFVRFQHVASCSLTIHDRCAVLDVNLLPPTCGQAIARPPRRATSYLKYSLPSPAAKQTCHVRLQIPQSRIFPQKK